MNNYPPPLEKILFLDIETAPLHYDFDEMDERGKELWEKKSRFLQTEEKKAKDIYEEKAGIFSEFSKVVCISLGVITNKNADGETTDKRHLFLKSLKDNDEKELLNGFRELLDSSFQSFFLCAHNGKEFDYPFLCRRLLINGITLPSLLDIAGKKPWEITHLDTMELWKFGDYKNYTSLDLLAYSLKVPSPKTVISGEDVSRVYHKEKDLEKIVIYCEKDVLALTQVYLRMRRESLIEEENVILKN